MPDPTIATVSTQTGTPSTLPDSTKIAVDKVDTDKDVQYLKILDATNASKHGLVVNADGSINATVSGSVTTGGLTDTQLRATAVPVSVSGVATAANQATANTALSAIQTAVGLLGTEATLTDLLASADAIFGAVDGLEGKDFATQTTLALAKTALDSILTKLNASIAVTGTFWQATQPVSGTVTANAGTNLNTSALALESGGVLDDIVTLLTAQALMLDGLETAIAALADSTETQPVSLASGLPAGTNNIGDVDVLTMPAVGGKASASNGYSVASGSIGATKTDIGTANTAGQVGGWYFYNPNSSVAYVQFFNTQASGVTLGTTAPVYSLGIPATSGANIAAGLVGIQHSTAICIAVTTTRAGSTGPGSTVDYNIFYKQ